MKIRYTSSVHVSAGWRSVNIVAEAERGSPGFAIVRNVITIDGESPAYGMTRTGAKRQEYDGRYVARIETGERKRISACEVVGD